MARPVDRPTWLLLHVIYCTYIYNCHPLALHTYRAAVNRNTISQLLNLANGLSSTYYTSEYSEASYNRITRVILILILIMMIITIIIRSSLLPVLEATYRLTPGCYGGSPSPPDMYDIYKYFTSLNYLYLTLSKHLLQFISPLLVHLNVFLYAIS
jgi:hypothetical protein